MAADETTIITTNRLLLTPLDVADAATMADVLADEALYEFTGGEPPTTEQLDARYRLQIAGSPRPSETWHNWIVRMKAPTEVVGFVQATITADDADVAWVIGLRWQHRGIAREAASAMCERLRDAGVRRITAHIHPNHDASAAVAAACGLHPTGLTDDDGEVVWESAARS